MVNITDLVYEEFPAHANQMRIFAQELNRELINAYTSIQNMHSSWYGKRYNALVKEFNNMVPEINELLELVVGELPNAVETIGNNYSQTDQGSKVTGAVKTSPKKVSTLAMPGDAGMRFISG